MAHAYIMDWPSGTLDEYERVIEKMDLGGRVVDGAVLHAAGEHEGGLRVVDVWTDEAKFDAFAAEKIGPLTAQEGLGAPNIQAVEVADLFDERDGGDGGVTLLQIVRLTGMDGETFQSADKDIRENGEPPDGCMFHVNGPTDDGWIVIDAWTSKDARDTFFAQKVIPAMQSMGAGPPTIEDLSIHNTLIAA
jgi:hypothetical protein